MNDNTFANLMRFFREQRGLSQNKLASITNLDVSYISRLESGHRRRPGLLVVLRVALALGCTPTETDMLLEAVGHNMLFPHLYPLRHGRLSDSFLQMARDQGLMF